MNKMAWAVAPSKWLVLRQTCLVALAVAVPVAPAWANTASDSEAETIFVIGQREAPIPVVPRGLSIS